PTATPPPSSTPAPLPTVCSNYTSTTATGSIVAGTTDIGNHCDDCSTHITLPFAVTLYNAPLSDAYVSSTGVIEFGTSDYAFGNACLPVPIYSYAVLGYWDDLITSCSGCGVFTSTSGTAPSRIFNVEWRAQVLGTQNFPLNFEIRLYEGSNQVDVQYGTAGN